MPRTHLFLIVAVMVISLTAGFIATAPWSQAAAGSDTTFTPPTFPATSTSTATVTPGRLATTTTTATTTPASSVTSSNAAAVPASSTPTAFATASSQSSDSATVTPTTTSTTTPQSAAGAAMPPAIQIVATVVSIAPPSPTGSSVAPAAPTGSDPPASNSAPSGAPAPQPTVMVGIVANTGGAGVYVRPTPTLAPIGTAVADGTSLLILSAQTTADGQQWYQVRSPDGNEGWVPAGYVNVSPATVAPAPSTDSAASAPAPSAPIATPVPPTPTPTPQPPTATPTPAFDYVVVSIKEVPVSGARDIASIRGRLIDRNGKLVPGTHFGIKSDSIPPWTVVEPHDPLPADGTVVFTVTRASFAIWVEGGRSQDAGWMLTGRPGQAQMSDWEVTFQLTH